LKKPFAPIVALILAAIMYHFMSTHRQKVDRITDQTEIETPREPPTPAPNDPAIQEASQPTVTPAAPAKPTPPKESIGQLAPTLEKINEEVEKNPHTSPESLSNYSLQLNSRVRELQNENEAQNFLIELEECVRPKARQIPTSAQALCLSNAEKVKGHYPNLSDQYQRLIQMADPEAKRLADKLRF
jgi:hypothetical protein